MSGIKGFFDNLSPVKQDLVMSVLANFQADASEERIGKLSNLLQQLKLEIDRINRRRQFLGDQIKSVETVCGLLEDYLGETGENSELVFLRGYLMKLLSDLRYEVTTLKPEKKLEKKFDASRRKESLEDRKTLVNSLAKVLSLGGLSGKIQQDNELEGVEDA